MGGEERKKKGWLSDLLDIIFPRSCISCGDGVDVGPFRHICQKCSDRHVLYANAPHCTTCGYPFWGMAEENRSCEHCYHLRPVFSGGRTICLFKGPIRRMVHALKYESALYVLEDIAPLMERNPGMRDFLQGAILVPVPLHPRKLRERGYNQSQYLAEYFCKEANGGTVANLLIRKKDTQSQTGFDLKTRKENLKNAFALAPKMSIDLTFRYILVDDVFTTGSTLNACAAVLRKAGVVHLDVATLAHG